MSLSEEVVRQFSRVPNVDLSVIGVFVEMKDGLAVVDVDGARLTMPCQGTYWPVTGERVRILRVGTHTIVWGPVVNRPTVGKVVAGGSPRCTVEFPPGSGKTQMMGYPVGQTATVGSIALIDWTSGGTVMAFATATPDLVAPEPPNPGGDDGPSKKRQTQTFRAVDSGSLDYRYGSWFTRQVWASSNTCGAWFYGHKIRDTIPDNATINKTEIYLDPDSTSGSAPIVQAHNSPYKPGGAVNFIGTGSALSQRSGWVTISNGYGDYLKSGVGGMGMNHGGFNKFAPAPGLSGALRITYTA